MRKLFIVLVSLSVGASVGGYAASRFWMNFYSEFIASGLQLRTNAEATLTLANLADLQSSRQEQAANRLNTILDSDILLLESLRATSDGSLRARLDATLSRIAEFRSHGAYRPPARIADDVDRALARAQGLPSSAASAP
jgi:hypothetical protein